MAVNGWHRRQEAELTCGNLPAWIPAGIAFGIVIKHASGPCGSATGTFVVLPAVVPRGTASLCDTVATPTWQVEHMLTVERGMQAWPATTAPKPRCTPPTQCSSQLRHSNSPTTCPLPQSDRPYSHAPPCMALLPPLLECINTHHQALLPTVTHLRRQACRVLAGQATRLRLTAIGSSNACVMPSCLHVMSGVTG